MKSIATEGISKAFGKSVALEATDLSIKKGEVFFLVGPSGCGKTTLLRIIAGLESADSGRVFFDGEDVTQLSPSKRDVGFVFQSYALWPHMTVRENIEFGLASRNIAQKESSSRIVRISDLLQLSELLERFPHELSGGQQQRVAIARSLVVGPAILLMDEPLSNLDFKLREAIRRELKALHREFGFTLIYVSHDFDDALALADRVAVLSRGKILACGSPLDLYCRPPDLESAKIVGPLEQIPRSLIKVDGNEPFFCRCESLEIKLDITGGFEINDISYRNGRCLGRLKELGGQSTEGFYAPLDDVRTRRIGERVSVSIDRANIISF